MSLRELEEVMEKQQIEFPAMPEAYQADLTLVDSCPSTTWSPGDLDLEVGLVAFCTASPELRFAKTESNFVTRNPKISTDASEYNHLLPVLPQDILNECKGRWRWPSPTRYICGFLAFRGSFWFDYGWIICSRKYSLILEECVFMIILWVHY